MSEEILVRYCSPTLAGIKTGNMFTCEFEDICEMRGCIRRWNHILTRKGLRVLPLCIKGGRTLVYVYRPSKLSNDLRRGVALKLLRERGYQAGTPEKYIVELIRRLKKNGEFPHEIGLFLSYPPEDVEGFIKNGAAGCKCVGCWKVYGDAEAAKRTFEKYKKCTDIYCMLFAQGQTLERLTVAT